MFQPESLPAERNYPESGLLRTSVIEDGSGQPVEIMDLDPALQILGHIPSPVLFLQALHSSGWKLDPKWQSSSYIHTVVRDLSAKQRFSKLVLIYCKTLEVVIVAGEEEPRAGEPLRASRFTPGAVTSAQAEVDTDGDTEQVDQSEAVSAVGEDLELLKLVSFILPGNSRMAMISGSFRRELDQELRKLSTVLDNLGRRTAPGWIIAITDAEEVTYYVEKQVSLDELKSNTVGETRDDVLSKIFGERRVVNWRTAARKEERNAYQKAKEERVVRYEDGVANPRPEAPASPEDVVDFADEDNDEEERGKSYNDVLKFIGNPHK